jgi:hypothetical protein
MFLFEHDLFGKPVPTFPDHALERFPVLPPKETPAATRPEFPGFRKRTRRGMRQLGNAC